MSPTLIAILTVTSFFTAILSAVTGMGGGIVLLSFMTFFLPLSIIVPIHGATQLISNSSRCYYLREFISWKIFRFFLIGLPFGGLLATYVIKEIENREHFLLFIAALILYTVFKPKKLPQIKVPIWCFTFVGLLVGFLGPLIGATGPFIAVFFMRDDLSKKEIVATKASVQMMGHLIKIPIFLYSGFKYNEYWIPITLLALATIFGTKYGVRLLHNISEVIFRRLYKAALLVAAARILYKVFL